MKISGMGYGVLRVTAEQLRELHTLPADIIFERTIGSTRPNWTNVDPEWIHDEHPFYFRIRHRYLQRIPDRGPLVFYTLSELKKQYADVAESERRNQGLPVTENMLGHCWVDD